MRFAASSLNLGRRLVFWMPVYRQDFLRVLQEEQQQQLKNESIEPIRNDRGDMVSRELPSAALPFHSCLRFVSASEQRLTSHSSRILLTYEKVRCQQRLSFYSLIVSFAIAIIRWVLSKEFSA